MKEADASALVARIKELEAENARLRAILASHDIDWALQGQHEDCRHGQSASEQCPSTRLSLQEKVSLFRSVFKGREDVFARRWYSATTQKSGYQPACEREWNPEFCDKRKFKCAECPNRRFAPLSYDDIFNHLAGKDRYGRDVVGLYVIMPDDTCCFLCVDFDDKNCEHGFQKDVLAFVGVCKGWSIPYYIERSRSGNGAHVWIFFSNPMAASKARRLGNAIMTEAMQRDACLSFKSYDRFFPNQDSLPEGGFGNLVALPMQGNARRNDNSVFVDENFQAYPDQWDVLLHINKIQEALVDQILKEHTALPLGELSTTCDVKPWETPKSVQLDTNDFPKDIALTRANKLYIPLAGMSPKAINHLKRIAAFRNPEFYAKLGMRLSTYNIPRVISCSELTDNYLALPRGCEDDVLKAFEENGVSVHIDDKTCIGHPIDVHFKGSLRGAQEVAMQNMLAHNIGTLSATTAFGKTVFALAMIARRKVNTLILVHNKALLEQWKQRIEDFLDINEVVAGDGKRKGRKSASVVGMLHSGKNTLHGIIDIALIQSCLDDNGAKPFVRGYGMVIVDECHHVSSVSFEQVLKQVTARYVYGLTATPIRKDGHQPIIFMQCGRIRYTADAAMQISSQSFERILVPRFTTYRNVNPNEKETFTQTIQKLAEDEARNAFIVDDIKKVLQERRTPIVLTSLTSHVRRLARMLESTADHVIALVGADPAKEKRQAMERLSSIHPSESLVVVATGKYIGEGFDYPRLDTLFLALPISWKGNIQQYAGRLHREYAGKTEVRIYDYVDVHVPVCDSMYRKRLRGYSGIGYGKPVSALQEALSSHDVIYEGQTYRATFRSDLLSAKHSVVISCAAVRCKHTPDLLRTLQDLVHSGIEVSVHVRNVGQQEADLSAVGISVVHDEALSVNCAVIDKSIVWYGSVNFFGYNSEEANIMRLSDPSVASEMMEVIYAKQDSEE